MMPSFAASTKARCGVSQSRYSRGRGVSITIETIYRLGGRLRHSRIIIPGQGNPFPAKRSPHAHPAWHHHLHGRKAIGEAVSRMSLHERPSYQVPWVKGDWAVESRLFSLVQAPCGRGRAHEY